MMFFNLIIILIVVVFLIFFKKIVILNRNKRFQQVKKFDSFNKNNLNNWMNLTKKERYDLSKQESISYLNKRKVLLEEIRKEYKKITEGNSKN
tara:strand:- start:371 stop:649 length:279 start_codon:yes stop_codon:yes gene_type:complete